MAMQNLHLTEAPAAYACMLIRRPADEAFRAFADPALTSRFWYSRSTGPMTAGAGLRWEWETYGVSVEVRVREVEAGRLIRFE
ncbi:SRPBCC domain-containing protein [Streptomyces sp. NPDC059708]|uniref:SRPBCC domain-containing protein n=1 Tax=Streptomyces sp. NPDC059708 TaxID=3346916 RepID=UPI0036792170